MGMKKIFCLLFLCVLILFSSCNTLIDTIARNELGMSKAELEEAKNTPDPSIKLTTRAAMMVALMSGEIEMEESDGESENDLSMFAGKEITITRQEKYTIEREEGRLLEINVVYPEKEIVGKAPFMFYIFGGGFIMGGFDVDKEIISNFSNELGAIVIVPEYPLAPEYKFPVAADDIYAAWLWVLENVEELNLDIEKSVLFGESAGGNFATGITLRNSINKTQQPKLQLLYWPSTSVTPDLYPSRVLFGGIDGRNYVLTAEFLKQIQEAYLEKEEDAYLPFASPLIMVQSLVDIPGFEIYNNYDYGLELPLNLPKTKIILNGADPLRDEGNLYAATLEYLGEDVDVSLYDGMLHGFTHFEIFPEIKEANKEAIKFIKNNW